MSPELRTQITEKLRAFLKREPSETEIINATTDANIIGWIRDDEQKKITRDIEKLRAKGVLD